MSRMSLALAVVALGALASPFTGAAGAAPPPTGMLVQLAPPAACYSTTAAAGCAALSPGLAIAAPSAVAVGDDGRNVYVGSTGPGATIAFSRNAGGALTSIGGDATVQNMQSFATDGAGLFGAVGTSTSARGAVVSFARAAADGALAPVSSVLDSCPVTGPCPSGDNGLANVVDLAMVPGGTHLYAVGRAAVGGRGALVVLSRDTTTQALAEVQCVPVLAAASGPCAAGATAPLLTGPTAAAVSPDGKFLYASAQVNDTIVGFALDGTGRIGGQAGCVWSAATATPGCTHADGVATPKALAASPDGRDLYVVSNAGIGALHRDTVSGALSFTQCFSSTTDPACTHDAALESSGSGIAVSPDGRWVYAGGGGHTLGWVVAYARDAGTGALTRVGCLSTDSAVPGCATAAGLSGVGQIAISPDSRYGYLAGEAGGDGNGALLAFRIQGSPSCQASTVSVVAGQSVSVPLPCTHSSGDAIVRSLSTPAKGTLQPVDDGAGSVTYTAASAASGDETLTFQATDGTNVSPSATATIHILPATTTTTTTTPPPTTTTTTPLPTTTPTITTPTMVPRDTTPPHARIAGLKRRMKAKALKGFRGTATDDRDLARVEVSLVRLGGGARIARTVATCTALTSRGRFHGLKVRKRRCTPSGFLQAKGTTKWSFALKHRLPKGSYVLTVRAKDRAGNVEQGFSARKGNRVAFTVT